MKIQVKVTRDDIKNGKPGDLCNCPIALALKREAIFLGKYVRVHGEMISYAASTAAWFKRQKIDLPKKARTFVKRFDNAKHVVPFEFELEVS